jgi:hypothetical protein
MRWFDKRLRGVILCLPSVLSGATPVAYQAWIPARWQGGPLEIARRAKDKTLPADFAGRDAIDRWYDRATLSLIEGTPVNCLLVTWSAGGDSAVERKQQRLVKAYAREAHLRGIAILGLVYPGADPAVFVDPAAEAELDGLLLEGEFPGGEAFVRQVDEALRAKNHTALVAPITKEPSALRKAEWPILATTGSWPRSRLLTEMGILAAPSSEPWLDSNIWLLRSLRHSANRRPVWLGHLPATTQPEDYTRAVADAAIAGGKWMVVPDDSLRAGLFERRPAALAVWRRITGYLAFYRQHSDWLDFVPFGPLGIVVDKSSATPDISDEYLNLIARRQVPYRVIGRDRLEPAAIAGLSAVLAVDLAPPAAPERTLLRSFAEGGGLLVAGRAWAAGNVPKGKAFTEMAIGKGRMIVYEDELPDPEAVSKDVLELVGKNHLGVRVFNMPSVLTYVAADPAGKRLLVQMLNYSNYPAESMTVRVTGVFQSARLYTPESGVEKLAADHAGPATEISIPKLALAGALLLE